MSKTYLIMTLMLGNDDFLCKCILLIYDHQSGTERESYSTHEENGEGFNKSDAFLMTKIAQAIEKGHNLTLSELEYARRRMKKYTNQLTNYLSEEDLLL